MRTIKQLLELMLERQELFRVGLCGLVTNLYDIDLITYNERTVLLDYIRENKPENAAEVFYWNTGEIAPRIEWINKQIEKL